MNYAIDVAVQDIDVEKGKIRPWFTGPLLSPGGYVVPPGNYNVQPYFYYSIYNGFYNNHWQVTDYKTMTSCTLILPFKMGIGKGVDWGFTPGVISRYRDNQKYYGLTDWITSFGIQLLDAEIEDPYPALKLSLRLVIPLGKYQHLDPKKLRTDVAGDGVWWPSVGIGFTKLWELNNNHFFEFRGGVTYFISTPVTVKGFNTYGGGYDTHAKVYNGNVLTLNLGAQYNLTQNWALAFDFFFKQKNRNRYKGNPGTSVHGQKLTLAFPSTDSISLAPALEYNFTDRIGLISGCWFSVCGRNTVRFVNTVVALNIYI